MKQFNCLIVDDEPIACDIISQYCSHLELLNVVAICGDAFEAKSALANNQVDIIFLDIHMPVLNGLSFLKTLKHPAQIIFTSAYKEHAVEAFDLSACDYLLKPFSLERFIKAIDKAIENLKGTKDNITPSKDETARYFFIKAEGKVYNIFYEDFLYAEAKGNYTRLVTDNKTILAAISFSNFEKLLSVNCVARVHRSFIVSISKVESIEGNVVHLNNAQIPIGNNYKETFLKRLGL